MVDGIRRLEAMKLQGAARVILLSYIPVIVTIMIMIVLRAQDLANETLNAGLEPSFFNPTTPSEAIISGFVIWIFGALFVGVLAYLLYAGMRRYLKDAPIPFLITTIILAVLLAAGLYLNQVPFAPEGAFEVLTCGIGYGVLIPLFYMWERDRELYGKGH